MQEKNGRVSTFYDDFSHMIMPLIDRFVLYIAPLENVDGKDTVAILRQHIENLSVRKMQKLFRVRWYGYFRLQRNIRHCERRTSMLFMTGVRELEAELSLSPLARPRLRMK